MKAIYFWAGFVLLIAGCEPLQRSVAVDANDVRDENTAAIVNMPVDLEPTITQPLWACEDEDDMVGSVDLNGEMFTMENVIAVPKNLHAFSSYLSAMPYTIHGDEAGSVPVVWGVADKKVAALTSHSDNNYTVEVTSLQDFFDTNGHEPQTAAGVCAPDTCNTQPPKVYPQLGCEDFTIVGLINLEGDWLVNGSAFPFAFEMKVYQRGRNLMSTPDGSDSYEGLLFENVVTLTTDMLHYECTLTSRTHCEGTVTDLDTYNRIGTWVADKRP